MKNSFLPICAGLLIAAYAPTAHAAFQEDLFDRDARMEADTPVEAVEEVTVNMPLTLQTELTRGEFTALVVERLYTQSEIDSCYWDIASNLPPRFTLVFTDVHVNDRYAKHICIAMRDGLTRGYSDGSFRSTKKINFAEGSKIVSRAWALAPYAELHARGPWYQEYVWSLAIRNAIPQTITRLDQPLTAGDAGEIIVRLMEGVTTRPARSFEELMPRPLKRKVPVQQKPAGSSGQKSSASSKKSTGSAVSSMKTSATSQGQTSSAVSKPTGIWNPF